MGERLRKSGIDEIGDVPWGTHFCQFYQTKEDLVEILVPYFKAGLENNELCVWITSQPREVEEAKEALKRAVPDIDIYLEKGQMEIIPYIYGYIKEGVFDPDRVVNSWAEKIYQVLARGYDGLRASGDNRWLEKEGWDDFVDYEKKVDAFIDKNLVIALCPYYLDMCGTAEIIDVISNHQFALVKKEGKWKRIENSGRKRAEKEAIQAAKNWKHTFDAVPDLVAIIDNEYRIVRANRAIAARLGVTPEECVGLTCHHVIHGTDKPPSFCPHQQSFEDRTEHTIEVYEDCLGGHFGVSTTPLHNSEGKHIGSVYVARDINELKREEHRIRRYNRILEGINRIFSNVVQAKTEEELGNACLSVALELTGSQFGFINETGADRLLHDVAKSELGWEQCLMYDKTGHRRPPSDYIVHGLYGSVIKNEKSFFTNDPLSHPDSIGLPDGHPPLTSFLGVPLIQNGKTVGLIAVANREGGYSCEQQEDLEAIAPAVTQALQRKKEEQEREHAERALLESDERFRSVLENSLDSAYRINLQNKRFDYMSPVIERITGFSVKDINAMSSNGLLDRIHPDDRPRVIVEIARSLEEGFGAHEYRFKCKDGKYRWLADHFSIIKDKTGMACFRAGIVRDITERKRAEEEVQETRNMLQLIMDNIPQGIFWKDRNSRYMGCNKVFAKAAGLEYPENIVGKTDYDLPWLPEQTERFREYDRKIIENDTPEYHIVELQQEADGKLVWIETNKIPLHDAKGNVIGILGTYEDITERKHAGEALRLSNLYNRSLIEASLDPLVTIGRDGKITDVNGATEQVTGYSRDDLIGTDFSDYFTEPEKAHKGYQQVFTDGKVWNYPLEIQHKDGRITPVLYNASVYKNEAGTVIGVFAAARDITERKKAEEKIQILANAVESSEDAIITKSLDGTITSWNKGAEKVYGYLAEEVLGKNISMLEPDDLKGQVKHFSEKIKYGERIQHYETLRLKKDGTKIDVSVTLSPVFDTSGELVAVSTIARDITEQKKAGEALRLSNIYNRSLIEASLDPLVTIGSDGKITDVNDATELVTGYTRNDLIGTDFSDYFTEPQEARKGYQQVFVDGEVRDYPLEIQHKDGSMTPVLYNASVYKDETGKIIGIFAAARDITERKKAEEALRKAYDNLEKIVQERTAELEKAYRSLKESEEGLAEAQRMAHIGNWDWDLVTGEGYWSNELYHIFGRSPQILAPSYDELLNYIHPDDREYVEKNIKKGLKEKSKSGIDYRIVLANGEERTVHSQAEVIFNEQKIPVRVKGVVQDITERKKIEAELELVARLPQENPDPVMRLSKGHIINYANPSAEVLLTDWGSAISKEAPTEITEHAIAALGGGIRRKLECTYANRTYMINIAPFPSAGYVNLYAHDITESKKAREALAKMEKIRIKEIHHRIKNNLQVISSLLDLQAERFQDKGILESFRESQNRITSMSLIHEELYKGEGNETLNFSAYLQKLGESLFQTYSLQSKNVRLCMDLEENTFLDMDIAVPLGIIVNELVSNSLKHAFAGDQEGEIRIRLCGEEKCNEMNKSFFSLTISDNGKGIPENIKLENLESLGLQLVNILVDQLDGKIELKREHGTEFRITFNVTERE